jgi:uncharacterized membrane protein
MAAIAMTMLCGVVGLGIDLGMWYRTTRLMQNAADSASIAAARDGTASYETTGQAVAAQYGFVNGVGSVTVTVANGQTCPSGGSTCYSATVTQGSPPRYFSAVLGYSPPALSSSAMANAGTQRSYCMLMLATSGTDPALTANGVPKANLAGCSIMSNTGMNC